LLKHVPNILTIFRFFLIPFIVLFALNGNYTYSIIFFTLSGITDMLDGYIARKYELVSDFGKMMDPLADKLVQISLLSVLTFQNVVDLFVIIIVILKELILIIGAIFLYRKKDIVSKSNWYGKASTTLFYLGIVMSMLFTQFDWNFTIPYHKIVMYTATFATIFSLVMYLINFLKIRKNTNVTMDN
jgi:CDP-diacylglycerol--glycerol-3-phosphate 3-phosphatidyltransferase